MAPGPAAGPLPPANWLASSPGPPPCLRSRTPTWPVCHHRHSPPSLPPANWLASSASDGRQPARDTAVPGFTPRGPVPPTFLHPACQLARLLKKIRQPPGPKTRVAVSGRALRRIRPSPAGCTTGRSAFTLVAPGDPWCIGAIPLYRPGAAGLANGGVFTNRAKDRADAQRLVATRLLDRLHDPLGHISRLQRIHPRAR